MKKGPKNFLNDVYGAEATRTVMLESHLLLIHHRCFRAAEALSDAHTILSATARNEIAPRKDKPAADAETMAILSE